MFTEPINFLFFFIPFILIFALFLGIVNINSKKQPFSLKTNEEIDRDLFLKARKKYYLKVIIFSAPITIIIPIIAIFIKYFQYGALLLTISIVTLTTVNFIFYMQGYKEMKNLV